MNASVPIIGALLGALILFFGRKLFWLCVAAVGFAAGVELAPHLVQEPSPVLALTVALVLGFVGALLCSRLNSTQTQPQRRSFNLSRHWLWHRSLN